MTDENDTTRPEPISWRKGFLRAQNQNMYEDTLNVLVDQAAGLAADAAQRAKLPESQIQSARATAIGTLAAIIASKDSTP